MRIDRLELRPYGHLSDARLRMEALPGGPGVQVLAGLNGAGKSTTHRALDGGLFGIDRRTPDAHTHPANLLRVALGLESADGSYLAVERHKRDRGSLTAPDGTPVDEATLRHRLGDLSRDQYRALFMFSRDKLVEGGRDLLAGNGLLGEALFGAATGLGRVHAILDELDEEAEGLWLKNGSRLMTREAKALAAARRDVREGSMRPERWQSLVRDLADAEAELAEVAEALRKASELATRTERHERVLPHLLRRATLLERLASLPEAPTLTTETTAAVRAAVDRIAAAEGDTARADLASVLDELVPLPDTDPFAGRHEEIDELHRRAGESAKAASDLVRRRADRDAQQADTSRLLGRVRPDLETDRIDAVRVTDADRALLEEVIPEHAAATQALSGAVEAVAEAGGKCHAHALTTCPEPSDELDALRNAVRAARRVGDLDGRADEAGRDAGRLALEAETACARLDHWNGALDGLEAMDPPSRAAVVEFAKERERLDRVEAALAEEEVRLDSQTDSLAARSRQLSTGLTAPARSAVADARRVRDDVIDRALTKDSAAPLPEAVRAEVRTSDELADQRADQADMAAARDQLELSEAELRVDCERLDRRRRDHEQVKAEHAVRWCAAWKDCLLEPASPDEMAAWLEARQDVLGLRRRATDVDAEATGVRKAIDRHHRALAEALTADDAVAGATTLGDALDIAERRLANLEELVAARVRHRDEARRLEAELDQARGRQTRAEGRLGAVDPKLASLAGRLGLPTDVTPAQARAQLTAIDELVDAVDAQAEHERRVDSLEADQSRFAAHVRAVASELAPDLELNDPVAAAKELHARAARALIEADRRDRLDLQARTGRARVDAVDRERADAQTVVDGFVAEVGVPVADAVELCDRADAHRALEEEILQVEERIEEVGLSSVSALTAELVNTTPESLRAAHEEAGRDLARLDARRGALERDVGRFTDQLESEGIDDAASAAERVARSQAVLRDALERYAELRLAAATLRSAIERHRDRHQGPMLTRASELFARLTGGRMVRLVASVDSKGRPVLHGVRPDDREVPVEGMSDGQRDQLFLALRLAGLELHFEHAEPMPLVLDDVLLNFDDPSATATLEVLGELAQTTQILFFTHHEHLVTLARDTVPANRLAIHRIGEETRSALRAA